jgi:hypothetical protein
VAGDRLFKQLCSPNVIRVGWHLAQADSRDDFVTDPIAHADFAFNLQRRLNHLIEQIQSNRYRPRHLLEIDVPKSGLSVRPGNVLPIEEATLLHAITYLLAPLLDKKLDKAVFSYRLHPEWKKRVRKRDSLFRKAEVDTPFLRRGTVRSINPFDAWYERWPAFEEAARQACTTEGFTHVTKTDITAYFENIDLRLLDVQIRTLLRRDEGKLLELLFRVLEGWTRATSAGTPIGRGIPQGNEVSSFLGNLYVLPLDRALTAFCKKREARWLRYVDDVKVFTKSERDAREVVFVINDTLRSLHLNLQGSKTRVLSGDDLVEELDDRELAEVSSAIDSVRKLNPRKPSDARAMTQRLRPLNKIASRFRRNLPRSVKNLDGKDNRLFRRLLTAYGLCQRPRLRTAALEATKALPDLRILRKTLTYLCQLTFSTHRGSFSELMSLLENGAFPFPFQVATVLASLADLHPMDASSSDTSRIRRYALSGTAHWHVIAKALEATVTLPYAPSRCFRLANRFLSHEHPFVRRAACLLMVRGRAAQVRKRLEELAYHPDRGVSRLSLFLRRLILDSQVAEQEVSRLRHSQGSDYVLLRSLPQVYALGTTESKSTALAVNGFLGQLPPSRSAKLMWHRAEILARTNWATAPEAS